MSGEKDISVSNYNQWSRSYRIHTDDGDDIPSGRDSFVDKENNRPVGFDQVANDIIKYYQAANEKLVKIEGGLTIIVSEPKSFGWRMEEGQYAYIDDVYSSSGNHTDVWLLQTYQLRDYLPKNTFEIGSSFYIATEPSYFLSAWFSYQDQEAVKAFLDFVQRIPIPLAELQIMERTAKARGNIKLGKKLHEIFESRTTASAEFTKLDLQDDWGDLIYLQKGSASEKAWILAEKTLTAQNEKATFAKALAYFASVEIDEGIDAQTLKKFSRDVPLYYKQGILAPPHLQLVKIDDLADGHYEPANDKIIIKQWDDKTYAHELGHFVTDLMDDVEGPNRSLYIAQRKDNSLLFDPERCNQLESVSWYGGTCDKKRADGTSKMYEDFAEIFAYVTQQRMQRKLDAIQDFWGDFESLTLIGTRLLRASITSFNQTQDMGIRQGIDKLAQSIHEQTSKQTELPINEGNDQEYLGALHQWTFKIDALNQASIGIKNEKIAWMRQLVSRLAPQTKGVRKPDPRILPWRLK